MSSNISESWQMILGTAQSGDI